MDLMGRFSAFVIALDYWTLRFFIAQSFYDWVIAVLHADGIHDW